MPETTASGVAISYQVTGSGPAVVLVAGFAADRAFWAGVAASLAPAFTVVTLDNRGVGLSTVPDVAYTVDDMAVDVVAVLDDVAPAGAVTVVGHSMGGAIAATVARDHPQRVASLVLAQSFARLGEEAAAVLIEAGRAYDEAPDPVRSLAESLYPWLFSPAFLDAPGMREELLRLAKANPTPQPRAGYDRQLAALTAFDASPWLERLDLPTLVVAADDDRLVTAAETDALLTGISGARRETIRGAGHCAPIERPDAVAALVAAWT